MLRTWAFHALTRVLPALILAVTMSLFGAPAQAEAEGTGSISGTVTTSAGISVDWLPVTVIGAADGEHWGWTRTAADGSYKVTGLPAGSYVVRVSGVSSGGHDTWYGGITRELATPVQLASAQDAIGIDIELPLGGTISGKVTVPGGFTFDKITVHSYRLESNQNGPFAWVDAQGNYLIKGLAPGTYTLYFYPQNPDLQPVDYGREPSKLPTPFTISGPEAVTGIDAYLPKASVIEGTLTLPEGATMDGVRVTARSLDNNLVGHGTVGPGSSYRITALLPGSYRIKVSAGASGMVDQWFTDGSSAGSATSVSVGSEETTRGINMSLKVAPAFSDVADGLQFSEDIRWLAARGVTEGFPDNTYKPLETIHRDAMAAFLYRAAGRPEFVPPAQSPFHDVTPNTAFYKEITWFHAAGITRGYDDGTFRPQNAVNRDAMAAFLRRYSNNVSCIRPREEVPVFTDNPATAQFAEDIAWMSCFGISTGFPDGTYRPTEPVRRDAMAAFLKRWSEKAVHASGLS
ncbi:hypothetical protein GCM10011577_11020 [Pseudarthrobacter polychromogenes]|uniref:SLH domain-containing protein n=2 Tax=Pseudarthrobacter polychromogenes TaxID=1676 RepID=A0ABQ1XE67_9MICC|nr:hypothetical protein GCM10011577_11020 [Pseudarthrobacter polychromogenes]